MDSILTSVKKMLGVEPEVDHFNTELIMHINANMLTLTQIGIGPDEGFMVVDDKTEWDGLLGTYKDLEAVKTWLYLKVRLTFDPPSNSFLIESINKTIDELIWRLLIQTQEHDREENQNG